MRPASYLNEAGRYGSQYTSLLHHREMLDRELRENGTLVDPEIAIRSKPNKLKNSIPKGTRGYNMSQVSLMGSRIPDQTNGAYDKSRVVPVPDQALERLMTLFLSVGIDGIGRVVQGSPLHDDWVASLDVYPTNEGLVGGCVCDDVEEVVMKHKTGGYQPKNKLNALKKILEAMIKKASGGNEDMPQENALENEINDYELKKPEKEGKFRPSTFIEALPQNAPPEIRRLLEQWGDATIFKARICRVPLLPIIKKVGNWASLGKLEENRKKLGYNDLFHLYVEVAVRKPDGKVGVFLIEKNEKAGFDVSNGGLKKQSECMDQPPTKKVTLTEMFKRAEKSVGPHKLWVYNLETANCQNFAVDVLGSGNGMLTAEGRKFALQSAASLLPKFILKVTSHVTNLANRLKSFLKGSGRGRESYRNSGGMMRDDDDDIPPMMLADNEEDDQIAARELELERQLLLHHPATFLPLSQRVINKFEEGLRRIQFRQNQGLPPRVFNEYLYPSKKQIRDRIATTYSEKLYEVQQVLKDLVVDNDEEEAPRIHLILDMIRQELRRRRIA